MFSAKIGKPIIVNTSQIAQELSKITKGAVTGLPPSGVKNALIKIQDDEILGEIKKKGIEGTLEEFFKDRKNIARAYQDTIGNKINHIVGMMSNSAKSQIGRGIYEKYNREFELFRNTGKVKFNKQTAGGILGDFIQDVMIFNQLGVPGNAPLPDIYGILTEIKSYSSFEGDWNRPGLKSGDITIGLNVKDNTNSTIIDLQNQLRANEAKELAAIIQLYIKMRNLLLIIPRIESGYTFHFAAIVFYMEILIRKIIEWVNNGIEAEGKFGEMFATGKYSYETKMVGGKPQKYLKINQANRPSYIEESIMHTPYIMVKEISREETTTVEGDVIAQVGYTIGFNNLTSSLVGGKWISQSDFYEGIKNAMKNLEDLYMYRYDILEYISGEGSGDRASLFFSALLNDEIPVMNFENLGFM